MLCSFQCRTFLKCVIFIEGLSFSQGLSPNAHQVRSAYHNMACLVLKQIRLVTDEKKVRSYSVKKNSGGKRHRMWELGDLHTEIMFEQIKQW